MNREPDLMPVLRGWLAAGERDVPERVRVAVMATIAAVPQRPRRWSPSWPTLSARRDRLRGAATVGLLLALLAMLAAAMLQSFAGSSPTPTSTANGWIAYATEPGHGTSPGSPAIYHDEWSDIHIVRLGGESRLIVGGDGTTRNVCPDFFANGEHLAYGEGSGPSSEELAREHRAIVVVALGPDGSIADPPIRLPVAGAGLVPCPIWSPDGQKLAYPEGDAIAVLGLDGTSSLIPDWDPGPGNPWEREFAWSPDGTAIAAARPSGTWVVSSDGGEPRRLSSLPATGVGWSPDGSWVATEETVLLPWDEPRDKKRGRPRPQYVQARLFSADGQHGTVDLGRGASSPLWSPSGHRLLFSREDGLMVAKSDGSDATSLGDSDQGGVVAWSPDGRSLLVLSYSGAASWTLSTRALDDEGGSTVLVQNIPTSSARSWPGRGDISWQAVIP